VQIERGYFIRAKCYLLVLSENKLVRKLKGTTGAAATAIDERSFKQCLNERKIVRASQTTIRSINNQMFTICQRKVVMSPTEYKRWYKNRYISYAYGDYRINNMFVA
jgi:hypothetical protein